MPDDRSHPARPSPSSGAVEFRFWMGPYGLIRRRSGPGWMAHPEAWVHGRWVTGTASLMDAISGMGEDPYSCGSWADAIDQSTAETIAQERGIPLYAPAFEET